MYSIYITEYTHPDTGERMAGLYIYAMSFNDAENKIAQLVQSSLLPRSTTVVGQYIEAPPDAFYADMQ